jgi:hypothetical protein
MDRDRFWAIIAKSRAGFDPGRRDGNQADQVERLTALLAALPGDEIVAFQRCFDDAMNDAYDWDLWGAAYLIGGGCSDDGFMDFRSWLISMGRDVYDAALRDPETLLEVADAPGVEVTAFEELHYVPGQAYEEKTGEEMPDTGVSHHREPAGDEWTEEDDDLARRFPRLWAKYGVG